MELDPETGQLCFTGATVGSGVFLCRVLISRELTILTGEASIVYANMSLAAGSRCTGRLDGMNQRRRRKRSHTSDATVGACGLCVSAARKTKEKQIPLKQKLFSLPLTLNTHPPSLTVCGT